MMRTSRRGIDLIKQFEGLELDSYQDVAGVWTIGYGHTETAGPNQRITEAEADQLLRQDLETRERSVADLTAAALNQNEFDALVSFVYNVGAGAYQGSTVRKRLNAGDRLGAADALLWWNKATINGVLTEVPGLTRRRAAERALFLEPLSTPQFSDPATVAENSRITAVEDPPRRANLAESRTLQGATVAAGAGAAGSMMGRDSAEELSEVEAQIAPGPAPVPVTDADAAASCDPEAATSDSEGMTACLEAPGGAPVRHDHHDADAQIQLALLILILLAIAYVVYARIEDWLTYRR